MLFSEKLHSYEKKVEEAVSQLFSQAMKFQYHKNDVLLVLLNGHYDSKLDQYKSVKNLSPYVFGPGESGLKNINHYEFYDWYRRNHTITGDPEKYKDYLDSLPTHERNNLESINIQLELMVYLKFWESDFILKQLYNLCRLIHGELYNWEKKLGPYRKKLINKEIIVKTKRIAPKFYNLANSMYIREVRNAAAHSQFRITSGNINLFNSKKLKNIKIKKWEEIFHKTILTYNSIVKNRQKYDAYYRSHALDKHFGHCLKRVDKNGSIIRKWVRLKDASDFDSRWIWYNTYKRHYLSVPTIIL